jgi:hypothetical protein
MAQGGTMSVVDLPATGTDGAIDINIDKTYTHTFDFGSNAPVTINGIAFEQGPTAGLSSVYTGTSSWGYGYTIDDTRRPMNVPVHAGGGAGTADTPADGGSNGLFLDFIYHSGGPIGEGTILILSDLTAEMTYSMRYYYGPFGIGAGRVITFEADGESNGIFSDTIELSIDTGGAHYLDYTFTADDTDVTLRFITHNDNQSAHIYGLSNEVIGLPFNASGPNPVDGAEDVPRDVVLSWEPGKSTAPTNGHKVYFGESFDDANDATGVVAQTAVSYAPAQRLDFGTTYYWRVDEVETDGVTVHKGNVLSFTTEPIAYSIEDVNATASSAMPDVGPENTVNGSGMDANDLHSTDQATMWISGDEPEGAWIEFEFDRVYKLHQMLVWNCNQTIEPVVGFGCKGVAIEYSADGTNYATLGTTHEFARALGTPGYAHDTPIDFGGAAAKKVRITANSNWGGFVNQYSLSEVRFMYIPVLAREPQPESGATEVDVDVTLSFRAGREAAEHNVYISTDEQAVIDNTADVTTVTEASHGLLPLDLGRTYYWKVNEVNDAETPTMWEGDIWNFTTPDFFVVDDFESYNDLNEDEPGSNRIYLAWADGFDNPAINGSIVGYANPPFAEQSIIHGGRQSLPFFYDNSTAASSEATVIIADLPIDSNWTGNGVKTLSLWFSGDVNNVPAQMYMKLNGVKVLYDGDASNLSNIVWQLWNINLADFTGVNPNNVTELSIGFERIGLPGGPGVVYFDNIRLYRSIPMIFGTFSIHPWTGDGDSGINSNKTYTHTGKFTGEGTDGEPFLAGNGVYFESDTNHSGTNWTLTGAANVFGPTNPVNVAGDGAALASGFFYGDEDNNHPVLTLTDLVPETEYVMTFYTVGFGGVGSRFVDITPGDNPGNPTRVDQNGADSGNGQLIKYTYTATGAEMSFTFDAFITGDSWHHYAFSNELH